MAEEKGMSFFKQLDNELSVTPEQEKAVAEMRKEGMGREMKGLPIVYPRINMLHQGTAAFQFVETQDVVKTFKGVFLAIEPSRVWWEHPMGSGKADGGDGFPDCYSRDLIAPDPESKLVQSEKCGTCPQNQWKSDIRPDGERGRGKACKEVRRVFIMVEGHMSPHWMTIPPSSLKALSSYFIAVRDKGFQKPQEVVTTFALKTVANKEGTDYSELQLSLVDGLPMKVLAMVADWKKRIEDMLSGFQPVTREDYTGKRQEQG